MSTVINDTFTTKPRVKFTNLGTDTDTDINTRLAEAWTANGRLSVT